jgi:hypothetical protein
MICSGEQDGKSLFGFLEDIGGIEVPIWGLSVVPEAEVAKEGSLAFLRS